MSILFMDLNAFRDTVWKSVSENQKRDLGFISDDKDGEFYMSFHDDFMKYFDKFTG